MADWLIGWSNRQAVRINLASGGPLTNYTMTFVLNTQTLISQGQMQANGNDIRFFDLYTITELPYWIESGINTSFTQLKVKIPSIPNGVSYIWLYWGNPSASARSDFQNILLDWDFFDDGSINPVRWSVTSGNGTVTESGGQLNFSFVGSQDNNWTASSRPQKIVKCMNLPAGDIWIQIKLNSYTVPQYSHAGVVGYLDSNEPNSWMYGRSYGKNGSSLNNYRIETVAGAYKANYGSAVLPVWLALQRTGADGYYWISFDSRTWVQIYEGTSPVKQTPVFDRMVLFGEEWAANDLSFSFSDFWTLPTAAVRPTYTYQSGIVLIRGVHYPAAFGLATSIVRINGYTEYCFLPGSGEDNRIYVDKTVTYGLSWTNVLIISLPSTNISSVITQLVGTNIHIFVHFGRNYAYYHYILFDTTTDTVVRNVEVFYGGFIIFYEAIYHCGMAVDETTGRIWVAYGGKDPVSGSQVKWSDNNGVSWSGPEVLKTNTDIHDIALFLEGSTPVVIDNYRDNATGLQLGVFKFVRIGTDNWQESTLVSNSGYRLQDVLQWNNSYVYTYRSGSTWYIGIDDTYVDMTLGSDIQYTLSIRLDGTLIALSKADNDNFSTWKYLGSGLWQKMKTYLADVDATLAPVFFAYLQYDQYDDTNRNTGFDLYFSTEYSPPTLRADFYKWFPEWNNFVPLIITDSQLAFLMGSGWGKIKVNGVWKDILEGQVQIGGNWKTISELKVLVDGSWKSAI